MSCRGAQICLQLGDVPDEGWQKDSGWCRGAEHHQWDLAFQSSPCPPRLPLALTSRPWGLSSPVLR